MKSTRRYSPWSILSAAMILSLAHCSDAALRSALYEPYPNEENSVPPSIEEFFGSKDEVKQNTDTKSAEAPPSAPTSSTAPQPNTAPMGELRADDSKFDRVELNSFKRTWDMSIDNPSAFAEALSASFSVPSATDDTDLNVSKLVLSIQLKTIKKDRNPGERHLRGELILEQAADPNRQAIEIVLRNSGPVVYTSTPSHDLMQARFRINSRLSLQLELSRYPTVLVEDIIDNPWTGSLSVVSSDLRDVRETRVGKISGFVMPLK